MLGAVFKRNHTKSVPPSVRPEHHPHCNIKKFLLGKQVPEQSRTHALSTINRREVKVIQEDVNR